MTFGDVVSIPFYAFTNLLKIYFQVCNKVLFFQVQVLSRQLADTN